MTCLKKGMSHASDRKSHFQELCFSFSCSYSSLCIHHTVEKLGNVPLTEKSRDLKRNESTSQDTRLIWPGVAILTQWELSRYVYPPYAQSLCIWRQWCTSLFWRMPKKCFRTFTSLPASSLTPVTYMQELQEILIRILWDTILKPFLR